MDDAGSGIHATAYGQYQLATFRLLSRTAYYLSALAIILSSMTASAADSEDISRLYGGDSMISLATGYSRPLFDAPTTAFTVTRQQIQSLGASNLHQVLDTLPGFHPTTNDGRSFQASVRGITNRVLILV